MTRESFIKDAKYRPIELLHDFHFVPCTFPQDAELPTPKERIDRIKALGYGGIGLNPSFENYLTPESIEEAAEWIRYAREQGLLVWIYDEKFYPSGGAGGQVVRENPAYEAKALAVVTGKPDDRGCIVINSPHGYSSVMAAYVCDLKEDGTPDYDTLTDITDRKLFGGGVLYDCKGNIQKIGYAFFGKSAFEHCTTSHNTRGVRRYTDTMNRDAVNLFLQKTFGGYEAQLGRLGDWVEGVFTDEPQNGALCREPYCPTFCEAVVSQQTEVFKVYDMPDSKVAFTPYIPWTEKMEETFCRQHGYELTPMLPRLFFDEGERGKRVRADYWQTVSDLFYQSYSANYAEFCEKQGLSYSGHFLYEEEFSRHPYMHGDLLKQLGAMHIPGCDLLSATPDKVLASSTAVKFATSAAQLYHRRDCMAEASNVSKDIYPITPEGYKLAMALEMAMGLTRFLSYYTDTCMPPQELRACCDYTARIGSCLADMEPVRNCFVYVPNRELMEESYPSWDVTKRKEYSEATAETHDFISGIAETLLRNGMDFNFINDEWLEKISQGTHFSWFDDERAVLVIPPHVSLPAELTERFVVVADKSIQDACQTLKAMGYQDASTDSESQLISLHKVGEEKEAYLLVNIGEHFAGDVKITPKLAWSDGRVSLYNPHTNEEEFLQAQAQGTGICLSIPSKEARIILLNRSLTEGEKPC